jgi:hypothetical protein
MREFTKALFSYSLAMSFFGLKQMQNLVTPSDPDEHKGPATKAFESVTNATAGQFGETLSSAFRMMDNVQRGLVSLTFSFLMPFSGGGRRESAPAQQRQGGVRWSSEPPCPPDREEPVSIRQAGGDVRVVRR